MSCHSEKPLPSTIFKDPLHIRGAPAILQVQVGTCSSTRTDRSGGDHGSLPELSAPARHRASPAPRLLRHLLAAAEECHLRRLLPQRLVPGGSTREGSPRAGTPLFA